MVVVIDSVAEVDSVRLGFGNVFHGHLVIYCLEDLGGTCSHMFDSFSAWSLE